MTGAPLGEHRLRAAVDDLANQLCLAVDGKFDFTVTAEGADETLEKLTMLVNFVLDAARRALAELERRNETLAELDRLKSDFVANVSHELRTPLALILGPADRMLSEPALEAHQRRDLELIRRNAATLLKHVNDLLDVSKIETGRMEVHYVELDLAPLLRLVAGYFEGLAPQRSVSYAVDVPPVLEAQVDPEKLERVVVNLVSNAFKFVPTGGRVTLSACALEGGRLRLTVEDTGPGVRPELRTRIFERFRQGDTSATRQFGGTGLGLAIAREFVELHRGSIEVTDAPGGGARFVVELPLVAPPGVPVEPSPQPGPVPGGATVQGALEELRPAEPAPPRAPAAGAARPVVLVVEDNPEMNRFVSDSLAGEYEVVTASDGRAGLERVLARAPDLVVTDLMMPVMSGDRMIFAIRGHRELDNLPILVLSARADDALRTRLLREGAQDYLVKPFSADELRARVGNWVRVKRARELLQSDLESQQQDMEELARQITSRRRDLRAALEAMDAARAEAQRASEVKTTFLSMASHELRTPLTAVQLQLDRLMRDRTTPLSGRQRQMVERASASSQRLLELVESLLEFARVDRGRLVPRPEPLDPAVLCAEVVDELRPRAERNGLELRLHVRSTRQLSSDPGLLRLVLINLVDNAIKFTERGAVSVVVGAEHGRLQLTVRDTGPGIPPELHARMFEPFEQLEEPRRKHKPGVGLGLAIVKRILEGIGGRIELRSEPGRGTELTVTVPELEVERPAAGH